MLSKQQIVYALLVVAVALQISAISTEHWSCKKEGNANLHMGLWKICASSGSNSLCGHLPPDDPSLSKSFPKNSLYAVRVFALLGVILVSAGLVCMAYMKGSKKCQNVLLVGGAVCAIIANVVWAAELLKYKPQGDMAKAEPGFSFYLNLGGALVALLAVGYSYKA